MANTPNNLYEILAAAFDAQSSGISTIPSSSYAILKTIFDSSNAALRITDSGPTPPGGGTSVELISPDGTEFLLTIDNEGNLITTLK